MNLCKFQQYHLQYNCIPPAYHQLSLTLLLPMISIVLFLFIFLNFGQVSLVSCWFTRENRRAGKNRGSGEFIKRCQPERSRALLLCYLDLLRQVAVMQSLFYIQTLLLSCRSHFYCVKHLISSIFFLIHNLVSNYSNYSCFLMSAISFQYLLFSNSISYHRLSSYFQL